MQLSTQTHSLRSLNHKLDRLLELEDIIPFRSVIQSVSEDLRKAMRNVSTMIDAIVDPLDYDRQFSIKCDDKKIYAYEHGLHILKDGYLKDAVPRSMNLGVEGKTISREEAEEESKENMESIRKARAFLRAYLIDHNTVPDNPEGGAVQRKTSEFFQSKPLDQVSDPSEKKKLMKHIVERFNLKARFYSKIEMIDSFFYQ